MRHDLYDEMIQRAGALETLGGIVRYEIGERGENAYMDCASLGYLIEDNALKLTCCIEDAEGVLRSRFEEEAPDSEDNEETVEIRWETPEGIIKCASDDLAAIKIRGGVVTPSDYDSTVSDLRKVVEKYYELYTNSRRIFDELMEFKRRALVPSDGQQAVDGTKAQHRPETDAVKTLITETKGESQET